MLHSKKLVLFYLSLFILTTFSYAMANPTVSKVALQNGTLQISGSGFGSHANNNEGSFKWDGTSPICAKFKDFEDGQIESQGFTIENGYTKEWYLSTSGTRTNSRYSGVRDYVSTRLAMLKYVQSNKSTGKLYVSFYIKYIGNPGGGKIWRWYFGNNSAKDDLYVALTESNSLHSHSEATSDAVDYWGYTAPKSEWHRYEFIMEYDGGGKGSMRGYVDGKFLNEETNYFSNASWSPSGHGVQWGFMSEPYDDGRQWHFDDLYVDYTQARVEIGNNASWSSCTVKEIQIPLSWGTSSISVQPNNGAFNSGNKAYLFVVDENGNVSNNGQGVAITIGEGGSTTPPTPTDNPPTVSITAPTAAATYTTSTDTINMSGNADDDFGISKITWSNNRGGSGNASNTGGNWSSFAINGIKLSEGSNIITVTATDSDGQVSTDTLTVSYTSANSNVAWSATSQTGDSSWTDSSVTYCVRLLIEGAEISQSGSKVMLAFQGRKSGSYTIKKVSIAERNASGSEGDAVNSTWTRVTFDGNDVATWDNDLVTVAAGAEKLSDPIPFTIQAGKDYYVTFKIESPSVYLTPPSYYQELYFTSSDHASDVDWTSNGHLTTVDYHALSKIFIAGDSGDDGSGNSQTAPPTPSGLKISM